MLQERAPPHLLSHKLENFLDMDSVNCENLSYTWVNTKVIYGT